MPGQLRQKKPNPPKILLLLQDSGKTLQQVEKDLNFYHFVEVKKKIIEGNWARL